LKFAYATNGKEILEFDYLTGQERAVSAYPTLAELFVRLKQAEGLPEEVIDTVLSPYHHVSGFSPRYYQQIAINRAVQAVLQGDQRVLLTMATGTGKTVVAFQICWKLWNARWNRTGEYRKPRILFLADRNVLIDDPKDKTFTPFGDARYKIENGTISKGREMRSKPFWNRMPKNGSVCLKWRTGKSTSGRIACRKSHPAVCSCACWHNFTTCLSMCCWARRSSPGQWGIG
jgi:type I restriction enzyme R subunit